MKLPSGPGAPAPDAADALTQATTVCRGIRTLTAEVAASGKVSGQRFRASLLVGVASPAAARIEAVAPFGAPAFIFAARDDDTTLLLPRDERVLAHGKSEEVLEAVTGVTLSAADLRVILTGCVPELTNPVGTAYGAEWRIIVDVSSLTWLMLHRSSGEPWQLVWATHARWEVEYRDQLNGMPRSIRVMSARGDDLAPGDFFDIRLALSQVETNVTLGDDVFRVDIPRTAQPITLDELRHARPGVREN